MSESNSDLNGGILKEQFVYPKNESLKESYIALLGMVKLQKKIRFYVHECVHAIVEQKGWISDYNPGDPKSKPDRNYKKALQHLKVMENPYFRFVGPGRIELRFFDATTKRQITSFDRFFRLCAADTHMSEYTGCDEEVIFEEWNDVLSCNDHSVEDSRDIAAHISRADSAVQLKTNIIKSTFETDFDRQEYFDRLSDELDHSEDIEV